MKVKILINGEEVEITLTAENLAEIEKQKKPKKFEFKYPTCWFLDVDSISSGSALLNYIQHGRYRLTKEAAEQSLARNKRANRLEALAEQLGGLVVFDDTIDFEYFHIFLVRYGTWSCKSCSEYSPEVVYMTKECAIEICRMLNEGEFEL